MTVAGPRATGRRRTAILVLLIVLLGGLLWIWAADRRDIHGSMEARRAVGARGMLRTGDFLIPRIADRVYLAKPPLFYWAVALASLPAGDVTVATLRLVPALSALATVLLLFFVARSYFDEETAAVAAAAFLLHPTVFNQATVGEVNMTLTLTVSLAAFAALGLFTKTGRPWGTALVGGAALAAGALTKGPIGPLIFAVTVLPFAGLFAGAHGAGSRRPLLFLGVAALLVWLARPVMDRAGAPGAALYAVPAAMLVWFAIRGSARRAWRREWWIVAATAVALSLPWPLLAAPALPAGSLVDEVRREILEGRLRAVGAINEKPIWFYLVDLPAGSLPLGAFAILAFLPGGRGPRDGRPGALRLLARCWLLSSLVFFTVASSAKSGRYLLPAAPATALLAGDVLVRTLRGETAPWMRRVVSVASRAVLWLLPIAAAGLTAWWFFPGPGPSAFTAGALAAALLGFLAALGLHRAGATAKGALAGLLLLMLAVKMLMVSALADAANERRSPRPVCERIRAPVPEGERVRTFGAIRASVLFYLDALPYRGDEAGPVFVLVEEAVRDALPLPEGRRAVVIERADYRGSELVLLRIESETAGD